MVDILSLLLFAIGFGLVLTLILMGGLWAAGLFKKICDEDPPYQPKENEFIEY